MITAGKKNSEEKNLTSSAPDKNPAPILAPTINIVARIIPISSFIRFFMTNYEKIKKISVFMSDIVLQVLTTLFGYCIIMAYNVETFCFQVTEEEIMDDEFDEAVEIDNVGSEEKDGRAISADLIRGHINTIILCSLDDGDKYGYEIIAEIEKKSHGQYSMKQPSLYSALKRLEKDGYVTSYWGGSVGGGRRKYFSLTEDGRAVSEQNRSEWEYSRTVIDSLISERDFDFSNPAPTSVDMRVLRKSTSRVPSRGENGEELDWESEDSFESSAEREQLLEEQARMLAEMQSGREIFEQERARMEAELEEQKRLLEEERNRLNREIEEKERTLQEERERQSAIFAEQERVLEAEKSRFQTAENERLTTIEQYANERESYSEQLEREREAHEQELRHREQQYNEENEKTKQILAEYERELNEARSIRDNELAEREKLLEEERAKFEEIREADRLRHLQELELQRTNVIAEQEKLFQERERDLIHQNYLNLVNTPPQQPQRAADYTYITPPDETESLPTETEREYRTVINRLYSNTIRNEESKTPEKTTVARAKSLDGIDYDDLENLAAQDGIRITTAGTKKAEIAEQSESIFNKGKALFLSALVVFVVCLIGGSLTLALSDQFSLPLFFPYFIWGVGLSLLLIAGVAFANRYGERAVRRSSGIVLVNGIVIYALLVIATLILALAVKIDFETAHDLATFVIIPILFFFNVVIFAIAYYLQIRPKK